MDAHLLEMASTPGRYRFHDLLRLYAREQAQAEETDEDRQTARRQMLEWYLDTADAAEALLVPGRRRLPYERTGRWEDPDFTTLERALAWFEAERVNLVAATHEAATRGLHCIVWQISDALWSFCYLRSYWVDGQDVH